MIHWVNIIYTIVILLLIIATINDVFKSYGGGHFNPSKRKGEFGIPSLVLIFTAIIFTLIWGGFFWW